jgi:uncharacterized SAM-binding protein YcdF (DUF218 family)
MIYMATLAAAHPMAEDVGLPEKADAIIVLGGDSTSRAVRAGELFTRGLAPRIVIAGDGDCRYIEDILVQAGVPQDRIEVECLSRNTWENAQFSEPILRRLGVRSAIVVTNWYHSRRALICFRAAAPDIAFFPNPIGQPMPLLSLVGTSEGINVMREYVKLAWYALRYGLQP